MEAARLLYGASGGKQDDFFALGIPKRVASSFEEEAFGIWPENLPAVTVFIAMGTQWRIGVAGVTGLDYTALPVVMEMMEVSDKKSVFQDIVVMESAALGELRKK